MNYSPRSKVTSCKKIFSAIFSIVITNIDTIIIPRVIMSFAFYFFIFCITIVNRQGSSR